jgi:AcrR family transcriptional regulator
MLSMSTSPKTPEPRAYHHGDLREALVEAGLELLVEQGAEKLSLREVARIVGVSHNAPYKHFPTREALLAAMAVRGFEQLAARIGAAARRARGDKAIARGVAYIDFALENAALFRLMFSGAIDRALFPEVRAASAAGLAELGNFVEGEYGREALGEATISAWAFAHGLAQLILDDQIPGATTPEAKRALARRVLVAMDHALSGHAAKR